MSSYPRIKEFTFDIASTFRVPAWQTGRLDLIAIEVFGDSRFYIALAAANNIRVRGGYRNGIRPQKEALTSELQRKGVPEEDIPAMVNEKILNSRPNNFNWDDYNNISYGYMSDTYSELSLLIPTFESADKYLQTYEYIEPDVKSNT